MWLCSFIYNIFYWMLVFLVCLIIANDVFMFYWNKQCTNLLGLHNHPTTRRSVNYLLSSRLFYDYAFNSEQQKFVMHIRGHS